MGRDLSYSVGDYTMVEKYKKHIDSFDFDEICVDKFPGHLNSWFDGEILSLRDLLQRVSILSQEISSSDQTNNSGNEKSCPDDFIVYSFIFHNYYFWGMPSKNELDELFFIIRYI
jgi:hypothetical protein